MNDNPLLGFIIIVLAMLVGYAINVIQPPEEVIPYWHDIHPIIVSPAVYAFAKQRGIFFAPRARRFIQIQ